MKYTILTQSRRKKVINLNPLKAIRLHCWDCQGFSYTRVDRCDQKTCTLWPYRLGKQIEIVKRKMKVGGMGRAKAK